MSAGLETLGPAAPAPDLDGPHLKDPAESGAPVGRVPDPAGAGPGSAPAGDTESREADGTPRTRRMSGAVRRHVGTAAGVLILGVLLWRLGTGVFVDGLRRIDGTTLTVAIAIGLLTTVFSAWRWCLVARELRIELPLGAAVADYYRALFLNAALPGGVLGDVHRAVRHGQSAGDLGRGVRSVVLERTAGQAALLAVGAVVLLTQPSPVLAQAREAALVLAVVVTAAAVALVVVRRRRGTSRSGRFGALRGALVEARGALLARRSWPGVLLSSVLVLAGHLAMFVLAARAAGSGASVAVLTPLALLALLAMGLPLNVGGWGPREGATAWAFGAAGLGAGMGLTVAVIYGVLSFAAALPGAVVLVVRWGAALRRPREESAGGPDQCTVSDVSSEKYAPKASVSPARSSFPFSASALEGRPMTPDSV
nr:lysylphosphatidylglycerol synthase transmembrane domain-containing protein [Streptomyces aureus]